MRCECNVLTTGLGSVILFCSLISLQGCRRGFPDGLTLNRYRVSVVPRQPPDPYRLRIPPSHIGRQGDTLLIKTEKRFFFLRWASLLKNSQKSINSSITEHLNAICRL